MTLLKKSPPSADKPSELDIEIAEAFVAMGTRDKATAIDPGLAKETLVSLMFRHADLLAETRQAKESTILYELATHLSGYDVEGLYKEKGVDDLRILGRNLMTTGRLHLAAKIYEFIVGIETADYDDQVNLASILHRLGREDEARALLTGFFRRCPIRFEAAERENGSLATLLCVYGYDKTRYKISQTIDGSFKRYRSGGHFMLKHLLDDSDYDVYSYTIADNNIATTPPDAEFDLLLNTIADADTEFNSLVSLDIFLKHRKDIRVVNHPSRVLETSRDKNYGRLNAIAGIRFPKTMRFDIEAGESQPVADQIERASFSFPLIVRETGTHTAVSTALVDDRATLIDYLDNVSGESIYAIEFVKNASVEGHYTKMRFFCIDGALYPVVHHIDQVWNVHGGNRKTFMAKHDWMIEQEKQFLNDPASVIGSETYALLQTLPEVIGLEFFGFDFTVLENGTILIFELNPAMRHSFTHAENFPYMRPHLEKISAAFAAMIRKYAAPT